MICTAHTDIAYITVDMEGYDRVAQCHLQYSLGTFFRILFDTRNAFSMIYNFCIQTLFAKNQNMHIMIHSIYTVTKQTEMLESCHSELAYM